MAISISGNVSVLLPFCEEIIIRPTETIIKIKKRIKTVFSFVLLTTIIVFSKICEKLSLIPGLFFGVATFGDEIISSS